MVDYKVSFCFVFTFHFMIELAEAPIMNEIKDNKIGSYLQLK